MTREKLNGQRSASQIIAEKLKGKNKPSERIPVLEKIAAKHKMGGMDARMDVFVQASSMLAEEKSKAKAGRKAEPMNEGIMGDLVAAMALSGVGGC